MCQPKNSLSFGNFGNSQLSLFSSSWSPILTHKKYKTHSRTLLFFSLAEKGAKTALSLEDALIEIDCFDYLKIALSF